MTGECCDFQSLLVQRDAAYWAAVAGIASVAAVAVNLGATVFLVLQLRANRAALEHSAAAAGAAAQATRIAALTARPWVVLDRAEEPIVTLTPDNPDSIATISCGMSFRNIGDTPALSPIITYAWANSNRDKDIAEALTKLTSGIPFLQRTLFPNEPQAFGVGYALPLQDRAALMSQPVKLFRLEYGMAGTTERFCSYIAFTLMGVPAEAHVAKLGPLHVPMLFIPNSSSLLDPT